MSPPAAPPLSGATAPHSSRPRRLGRDDWLVQGLAQLTAHGPAGIQLEALCRSLGKTRGSFYHHFADHDAFIDQMMDLWRDLNTEDISTLLDSHSGTLANELADFADELDPDISALLAEQAEISGAQARDRLSQISALMDQDMERSVRRFSLTRPAAMDIVAQVDAERIGFLARLLERQFDLPINEATALAEVEYAVFIGCQHLFPNAPRERIDGIAALAARLVTDAASAP